MTDLQPSLVCLVIQIIVFFRPDHKLCFIFHSKGIVVTYREARCVSVIWRKMKKKNPYNNAENFFLLYVNAIERVSECAMYMRNIPSISPTTFLSPECPSLNVPSCSLLPSLLR